MKVLHNAKPHLNLIPQTRALLIAGGTPFCIENVEGARDELRDPVMLCGRQFGLGAWDTDGVWLHLDRERLFESNLPLRPPPTCRPHNRKLQVAGLYGGARRDKVEARTIRKGGYVPKDDGVLADLLGVPRGCMTFKEMCEAIPPTYTELWGRQALPLLAVAA